MTDLIELLKEDRKHNYAPIAKQSKETYIQNRLQCSGVKEELKNMNNSQSKSAFLALSYIMSYGFNTTDPVKYKNLNSAFNKIVKILVELGLEDLPHK